MTEVQIQEEAESVAAFEEEVARAGNLQTKGKTEANFSDSDLQNVLRWEKSAVLIPKRFYNLAKNIKTMGRRKILEEIVLQGLESN